MAKRSPILGYNHNVRYRGLVFHVQTEDSGVRSPHLFTHLFYEGVIVSSRKLVYDAGSDADAIKSLMQAQHKAVMKDLNRHAFDDKIDVNLAGTPGLEPRAVPTAAEGPRPSDPEITIEPVVEPAGTPEELLDLTPIIGAPEPAAPPTRAKRNSAVPEPSEPPPKPRTQTADRTSRSPFRSMPPPPPPPEDDVATLSGNDAAAVAAAITAQAAATVPTAVPTPSPTPVRPAATRAAAAPPPPIPATRDRQPVPLGADSSPEIEIISDERSSRNRAKHDTAVDNPFEDGIPSAIAPDATVPSDGIPGRVGDSIPPLPPAPGRSPTPMRAPASHNAATLPAVRQPSRPAITPASVVSRPLPPDQRHRENTDAIEVYAAAPPSVEPPPGEKSERPGQYSMSRRAKDGEVPMREHTGRVAIPAGLGRPRNANSSQPNRTASASQPPMIPDGMRGVPVPVRPEPTPSSERTRAPSSQSDGVPRTKTPSTGSDGVPQPDSKQQPRSSPHVTAPITSRSGTGNPSSGSTPSNVVMTRPAVIVGAPPKPSGTPTPQRVRKAREDEGRGFGQGLISEKSLDEVILAYLSEDADEK